MADPRVTWRIGVDDNVTRTLRGIDARIGALGKSFRTLGGFTGFAALTASLTTLIARTVAFADEIQDASERTGVSAENLQRFAAAAKQTGTNLDAVERGLKFISKRTDEAARGSKEAAQAFARMGIDATALSRIPVDRRLAVVAEQLRQIPDAGQRAAAAMSLLGKGGAELLPLLLDLENQLGAVNDVMSNEQVKALADAKDAWERLWNSIIIGSGRALASIQSYLSAAAKNIKEETSGMFGLPEWDREGGGRGRPGGGRSQRRLSDDEAAAIIGVPTPPQVEAINKALDAARKKAQDEAERNAKAIADIVERNRTPLEAYEAGLAEVQLRLSQGLSADVAVREIQRLGTVLGEETQAMVDATQAGRQWKQDMEDAAEVAASVKTDFDRLADTYLRLQELADKGLITPEIFDAAKRKAIKDYVGESEDALVQIGGNAERLLEQIRNATDGVARDITAIFFDSTNSIADAFDEMFKRIAQSIIEQSIVQPLLDNLFGALGGLIGGGPQLIDLSKLPKRRAIGGPVMAHSPYIVGERGPELFVPQQTGRIVPNGSAAPGVTFNLQSPDPSAAAAVLVQNEDVIVNLMRRAYRRAGKVAPV